ncbi:zinc finger protein 70-like isoform X5 [Ischnura elegans]|uniref:zinc finger protein 70-like isoform X5 n=1 Tax=Ischnura elegans TaxID=197161 RepID=UPI001ED8A809|nr:zinc finger protein 70-like isoform X5 [Ischnura elegans]
MGSKSLLDKLCRICTAEQDEGIFIFGEEGKRLFLEAKMKKYLYIAVSADDRLPKMVCTNCSKKLESIHRFASMAVEMQDKLTVLVSSASSAAAEPTVKVEQLEGDLPAPYQDGDAMEEVEVRVDPMPFLCAMEAGSGAEDAEGGSGVASPNAEAPDDETAEKLLIEKRKRNRVINKQISSFYRLACKECEGLGVGDGIGEEGVLFETYGDLDAHCLEHHGKRAMIECRICGKVLSSRSKLIAHRLHHMGGFAFRLNGPLQPAKVELTDGEADKNGIDAVMTSPDSPSQGGCTCPVCGKRLSTKGNLKVHLESHRPKGRHDCDICGRLFKTETNLYRHKEYHKGKQFPCPVCGRVYPTRSTLRAHSITHSDLRPHACPYCEKTFKRNQDLKFHLNQHTGERPYKCPYCPKAFASSGNCFSHRKRMHAKEVERDRAAQVR